jgi:hypothetical protein
LTDKLEEAYKTIYDMSLISEVAHDKFIEVLTNSKYADKSGNLNPGLVHAINYGRSIMTFEEFIKEMNKL